MPHSLESEKPFIHGRVSKGIKPQASPSFESSVVGKSSHRAASRFQEALQHGGKGFKHGDKQRRCRTAAIPDLPRDLKGKVLEVVKRLVGLIYSFMQGTLCSFPAFRTRLTFSAPAKSKT